MMTTVARRNRTWTPELITKLTKAVHAHIERGNLITEAFQILAPEWGASPGTLSGVYYKYRFNPPKNKVQPSPMLARITKAPAQQTYTPTVQQAIDVLRNMGFNITLTI